MVIERASWDELDDALTDAITAHCGPVYYVTPVGSGFNSQLAIIAHTENGTRVFIKGLRSDHPRARTQHTEATINPYVHAVAPQLLWTVNAAGWDLLGFDYIAGRSADFTPGSADLPAVLDCLRQLQTISAPDLPLKRAEHRWRNYVDDPADLEYFAGNHLLHTDFNPDNILVADRAYLVDWAWATRGAAWIDPTLWALWLIATGHSLDQAEQQAGSLSSWAAAPAQAVTTFIRANHRLWAEIATDDPDPWTARVADAAKRWDYHRSA